MTNTPKKILLVDDDETNLELFEALLKTAGCLVLKARDGIEALDRFDKYRPDLVIVDLMMPRLNGLELCARLRRNPDARNIPILVLSGLDETATRQNAINTGATDFLAKPFKADDLLLRVNKLLNP